MVDVETPNVVGVSTDVVDVPGGVSAVLVPAGTSTAAATTIAAMTNDDACTDPTFPSVHRPPRIFFPLRYASEGERCHACQDGRAPWISGAMSLPRSSISDARLTRATQRRFAE